MLHPLLQLVATRPQLLAEHVGAYAEVLVAQIGSASVAWRRRAICFAVGVCCAALAAVLGGVALMLWAVTPPSNIHAPWALFAGPFAPALVSVACFLAARRGGEVNSLHALREQLRADLQMLREAGAS
ncbi:MAG: hypothetical protein AD742_15785 [Methylibium sp. NZG]|nr:MAG: hypothetical protein AD742_15785 [Methylibium sp. NZG]